MQDRKEDFQSLIDGLETSKTSWISWYWKVLQLIRWFITNAIMITLKERSVT